MNIFNEIYGAYFRTVGKILRQQKVTDKEISRVISCEAFADSMLFIPQKLTPDKNNFSDWGLLTREGDFFLSKLKFSPPKFLTALHKSWLKAKLSDPKISLFLSDETIKKLEKELAEVSPLYRRDFFNYFDIFKDGDNFEDTEYRRNFRRVLKALKCGGVIFVDYHSPKGSSVRGMFYPVKLEYSVKNDRFRLYCMRVVKGKNSHRFQGCTIFNMGRINSVRLTNITLEITPDSESFFSRLHNPEPVVVQITEERNGIERFMTEFAGYKKKAEFDYQSNKCTVWLWYDKTDENELLIRLLGFGPVLKIISPESLKTKAEERINRQCEILNIREQ